MKHGILLLLIAALVSAQPKEISGTWVAKRISPMGEMEVVLELKANGGKIAGTQKIPFGEALIVDGKFPNDSEFEPVMETESCGDIRRRTIKGKAVGGAIEITPAMPQRPAAVPAAEFRVRCRRGAAHPPPHSARCRRTSNRFGKSNYPR